MYDLFLEILSRVSWNLRQDQTGWGDPVNRLANLGLVLYHRIGQFLIVRYGVDERRRIVYIKDWEPRPGHPLADE